MATTPPDLAPIKAQVYKDPRPKEYFDRFHERSRTREPDWVYDLVRVLTTLYSWAFFRTRGIAAEKVLPEGPVILAPNHFSFMDHFFAGAFIRRRVRFMAKSQLFKGPMEIVYSHGGVFPVRRGARDEEMFATAELILARGGANSCDLAMKRTRRRMNAPAKKWSMNEKWLGARITGPRAGTFSSPTPRARKKVHACSVVAIRTAS